MKYRNEAIFLRSTGFWKPKFLAPRFLSASGLLIIGFVVCGRWCRCGRGTLTHLWAILWFAGLSIWFNYELAVSVIPRPLLFLFLKRLELPWFSCNRFRVSFGSLRVICVARNINLHRAVLLLLCGWVSLIRPVLHSLDGLFGSYYSNW